MNFDKENASLGIRRQYFVSICFEKMLFSADFQENLLDENYSKILSIKDRTKLCSIYILHMNISQNLKESVIQYTESVYYE